MGLIEKSEVIDLESEFVNGKRKFLKKIEILKNRKDSREKYYIANIILNILKNAPNLN